MQNIKSLTRFSFIPNHLLLEFTMLAKGIMPGHVADKLGIHRRAMYALLRTGRGLHSRDIKRIGHMLGLKDEEIFVPRHPLTGLPYHKSEDPISLEGKRYEQRLVQHLPSLCVALDTGQEDHRRFYPPPEETDLAQMIATQCGAVVVYPHLISFQGNIFAWYDFLDKFSTRKITPAGEKEWIRQVDVAILMGITRQAVSLWAKKGIPPGTWVKVPDGRGWLADADKIREFIKKFK